MVVLVGADSHVTVVELTKFGRKRSSIWFRYTCSCPNASSKWYSWEPDAVVQAEVHARLWHGAEPDRKWRR